MHIFQRLEQWIKDWKEKNTKKPLSAKERWMLCLLSGILLAVIVFPSQKKETTWTEVYQPQEQQQDSLSECDFSEEVTDIHQYEAYLSQKLKNILEEIEGAGKVDVWVTLEGSSEKVLYVEKDSEMTSLQEKDSVGGTREEKTEQIEATVLEAQNGDPYIVKVLCPKVEGVLVVAEGADDAVIKKHITEAVEVLFGIDAHRIKIAKKKMEE